MITFGLIFNIEFSFTRLNLTIELSVDVCGVGSDDESPKSPVTGKSFTIIKISIKKPYIKIPIFGLI